MSNMTLGQKIRALRLAKQMTQKELSGDFITRNMLSQIENDSATPSMKTMEHIAKVLDKPIGYFLDEQYEELNLSHLINKLINYNDSGEYEASVALINDEVENNPKWENNHVVMDLFINCHMYLVSKYMKEGKAQKAYDLLKRILKHEKSLLKMSDIYLYQVYDQFAEAATELCLFDEAKAHYEKGRQLIDQLLSSKEVQSLYLQLMEGGSDDILEKVDNIDTSGYDAYSLGRFNMVIGSSLYRKHKYLEGIEYLEKALSYYKDQSYNSVTILIYEELSKCYSELNDYKKAYDYLQLAQEAKL